MKPKVLGGGLFCMALLGVWPAQADTTYYYVGNPYTYNTDPTNLGTNMTGSVTFNFDTSSATGTYYLSGGSITDLQLTSGIYSVDATVFYAPVTGPQLWHSMARSAHSRAWMLAMRSGANSQ
jgi:hypothetical protein